MTTTVQLTEINGIGAATAAGLNKAGIGGVHDLANASIEDIAAVPGFGYVRAQQVRGLARFFLGGDEAGGHETTVTAADEESDVDKKPKKKEKKKKDGKKDSKDKKKDKKEKKGKKKKK